MSELLENYLDTVEALPLELQRNYSLIQEIDGDARQQMEAVEAIVDKLAKAKTAKDKQKLLLQMDATINEAITYAEKKVTLSSETYNLVDKHVRRIDEDLQRFEDELTVTGLGMATTEIVPKSSKKSRVQPEIKRTTARKPPARDEPKLQPPPPAAMFEDKRIASPIDPNEPTYCICKQVSRSQMIACDSEDCEIEWFHYECVGISEPPHGTWYCPDCTKRLQL